MNEVLAPLPGAAAIVGAVLGLIAERLATHWPDHLPDHAPRGLGWRTAVLMLSGGIVGGGLAVRWAADPRDLAVLAVYSAVLLILLATDLDQRILPDLLTLPLIAFTGAALLLGWAPLLAERELGLVSGLAAGIGAPVLLWLSDRVLHGDLGAGDLKLAVSIGFMSGISQVVFGLLVASIGFSAVLLALIATRRLGLKSAVPFGPVLIFGAFVAVLFG